MSIVFKDIDDYSQKSSVSGAEKIPVSDTEYITPAQIRLGNAKVFYGTCSTAGSTAVKTVTCPEFTSADFIKGALIFVTFDNENSAGVTSLKMNVNSTGEIPLRAIFRNNAPSSMQMAGMIQANVTYLFTYTGGSWTLLTCDYSATVYNSTITIQMNGSTVDTFTTNASSAKTIDLGGNFPKYYLCEDEAEYEAIQDKDAGTLYLIPESS